MSTYSNHHCLQLHPPTLPSHERLPRPDRRSFHIARQSSESQVLLGAVVGGTSDPVAQAVVFAGKSLTLLLQGLNVKVFGLNLLPKACNLSDITSLSEAGRVLAARLFVALKVLDAVLKAKDLKDHGIGTVEDERQEESEAAKVHVSLRVELASLDFHAICAKSGRSTNSKRICAYGQNSHNIKSGGQ